MGPHFDVRASALERCTLSLQDYGVRVAVRGGVEGCERAGVTVCA